MRIALLCKRYYTHKDLIKDKFGRLFHLPVQLAKLGHDITVFAIDYRNTKVFECTLDGVTFSTLPAAIGQLPLLPYRTYRALSNAQPDILMASGDSHIGYMAWRISQILNSRFIFDVYDYYPVFRGNQIPGMKAMFKRATRKADLVLCASRPLQTRLEQLNSNTQLVENGVDASLFRPIDKQAARQYLGIQRDIPVIGFFGAITPQRGPLLFEACTILCRQLPNLKLLLAGRSQGVNMNFPWVDYRGELPQQDVPQHIAACDVVTLPYANDEFNNMAGPCKVAEYLACARPVVATKVAGQAEYFQQMPECLCEPNIEALAKALELQLNKPVAIDFPYNLTWGSIASLLNKSLREISEK